jgi:ubiquinone/menaquinone biosynthesis C-methylase UbiE
MIPKRNELSTAELYTKNQRTGLQGWGNGLIDKLIERKSPPKANICVLEIGGSSGEHLLYVKKKEFTEWGSYTILDLNPGETNPNLYSHYSRLGVKFKQGNIESMPFPDKNFDLVISTCVLAHVKNPETSTIEINRVLKTNGTLIIGMPCDPGMLNRLIKTLFTYPIMRRNGSKNPKLEYAREHRNPIGNLITILDHVFYNQKIEKFFFPFRIKSWNLNLILLIKIKKIEN